ncbi:MAG: hypothetical protein ACKO6J_04405, partial [Crocinitomicaceae bacterium]
NGNRRGLFKQFLASFSGNPRIAWYPSAGEDFRALMYLNDAFSLREPCKGIEPAAPDLFLYTDYFPWTFSQFLRTPILRARVNSHLANAPYLEFQWLCARHDRELVFSKTEKRSTENSPCIGKDLVQPAQFLCKVHDEKMHHSNTLRLGNLRPPMDTKQYAGFPKTKLKIV